MAVAEAVVQGNSRGGTNRVLQRWRLSMSRSCTVEARVYAVLVTVVAAATAAAAGVVLLAAVVVEVAAAVAVVVVVVVAVLAAAAAAAAAVAVGARSFHSAETSTPAGCPPSPPLLKAGAEAEPEALSSGDLRAHCT